MVSYVDYVRDGSDKTNFNRPYREALIYSIINHFEQGDVRPDNAVDVEEYSKTNLTFEQKRRLRNQIFREMKSSLKEYNATHSDQKDMYDSDLIIDAFFKTKYGKEYSNHKSDWVEGAAVREDYINKIKSWSNGQDLTQAGLRRIVISPYDPLFAKTDLFGESYDGLGYVIGDRNPDGTPLFAVTRDGKQAPRMSQELSAGRYISKVHRTRNGAAIMDFDDSYPTMRNEVTVDLEGPLSSMGYREISHYIKTRKANSDIRNYLRDNYNTMKDNGQDGLTPDEIKFMGDVCRHLSESGIDFSIELNNEAGGKTHIVAKLAGSRTHIRLLDMDNPQYQGRIYDEGRASYVTSPLIQRITTAESQVRAANPNANIKPTITSEDRLNMIKWYFGTEPVYIDVTSKAFEKDTKAGHGFPTGRRYVGESGTVGGMNFDDKKRNPSTLTKRAKGANFTESSSILLSVRDSGVSGVNGPIPITIMNVPSANGKRAESQELVFAQSIAYRSDDFVDTSKKYNEIASRIPEGKELPGDIIIDDEGNRVWSSPAAAAANIKYYQHLIVREKLNEWVESAKTKYMEEIDLDGLFQSASDYVTNKEITPVFSSNENIAEVQNLYWKILTQSDIQIGDIVVDKSVSLDDRKNFVRDHLNDYLYENFGEVPDIEHPLLTIDNSGKGFNPEKVAQYVSTSDSNGVQKNYDYIRHMLSRLEDDYSQDYIKGDTYIGDEIKKDLLKFNPNEVVGSFTLAATYDAQNHMFKAGVFDAPEYAAFRDRPVTLDMMKYTGETLARSGVDPNTIRLFIDSNGIIQYEGIQTTAKHPDSQLDYSTVFDRRIDLPDGYERLTGQIGQIFEPDEYGAIHPKYAVPDNKVLVPGYEAYLVDNDPEDPKSCRERLRLSDWKHQMKKAITKEIHQAAFSIKAEYEFTPNGTSLNRVYRHAYDTVFDEADYKERLPKDPENPTPEELTFINCIKTLHGRCRFPNSYDEGSTTMTQSMLEHASREEAMNYDYYYSDLNDNRNLRVLDTEYDGIFDVDASGTAKTQGIVRYLVEGAEVNDATGKVTGVDYDPNGPLPQCALMADDLFRNKDFNTWDRRLMAFTQTLTALHTPRQVGAAMFNIDGWNIEDGYVISKKFAEQYAINSVELDVNDKPIKRPLIIQDKLSDFNGNKGVISAVIDPDLYSETVATNLQIDRTLDTSGIDIEDKSLTETYVNLPGYQFGEKQALHVVFDPKSKDSHVMQAAFQIQKALDVDGMDDVMRVFKDNPDLDVVMAPYSGMSRFNGGSIKSLSEEPHDLIVNGETIEGGMGKMEFIVVDMPADVKTHIYSEEAIKEGKGRKASGQLAWALQSKGATAILHEFYGSNQSAMDDLREYMIATGLDLDEKGYPVVGYRPQENRGEYRNLIKLPEFSENTDVLMAKDNKKGPQVGFNAEVVNSCNQDFMNKLNETGGFLELPFNLKFNTLNYVNGSTSLAEIVDKESNIFGLKATGQSYKTSDGVEHKTYGMPVLPQSLRSGQDYQDGTTQVHDYTNRYLNIYKQALMYKSCEEALLKTDLGDALRSSIEAQKEACVAAAQAQLDNVTQDIVDNRFNTKHNVIRDKMMANRLEQSGTAVWSGDPRLNINEIAMSSATAKKLGFMNEDGEFVDKEGPKCFVWRDPVLHDPNVRYMNVVIRENLTGVAIHPMMAQCFDGDFDGDSVAIVNLKSKAAKAQAYTAFSFETNMLNKGAMTTVTDPTTGEERQCYPLYINDGLDVRSNAYVFKDRKLMERHAALTIKVNELEEKAAKLEAGELNSDDISVKVRVAKKDKSGYEEQTRTGKAAVNYLRKKYLNEMNDWAHDATKGIATDHIVVQNEQTVTKSVQHIVETGAKGNQSKMYGLMDNLGYVCKQDADGRPIPESVKQLTDKNGNPCSKGVFEGNQRHIDNEIQETAAYKADNTSLGGTTAQQGVSAFRDYDITAALEATYPITQAILQSKHDPQDAKIKDEIVRFWGKDVWNGYKLQGDWSVTDPNALQKQNHDRISEIVRDGNGNPIPRLKWSKGSDDKWTAEPMKDEDGNVLYETRYVKCTTEEWKAQMRGMMTALKVEVNDEYIDRLADIMTRHEPAIEISADTGKPIYPVTKTEYHGEVSYKQDSTPLKSMKSVGTVAGLVDFAREKGSLLDNVAYSDRYTALVLESLKANSAYRERVEQSKLAYILGSERKSFAPGVDDAVRKSQELLESAKSADDAKTKRQLISQSVTVKSCVPNSSSFVSDSYKNERIGDMQRSETGASKTVVTKVKNGEFTDSEVKPKPIGRKDTICTDDKMNAGGTYMGESQADYEKRLATLNNAKEDAEVQSSASVGDTKKPVSQEKVQQTDAVLDIENITANASDEIENNGKY